MIRGGTIVSPIAGVLVSSEPARHDATTLDGRLTALLEAGDAVAVEEAKAALIASIIDWMRSLARRMLGGSPEIRRWAETDDIVQGGCLRLYKALGTVTLNDPQHFVRLAALQIRRELIDLSRRLGNPASFAANHDTSGGSTGFESVDRAGTPPTDEPERLADWTRFHEAADSLPEHERDLFGMVWYVGLSQDEIASLLGCSPRTVRRRWDEVKRRFIATFHGCPPE